MSIKYKNETSWWNKLVSLTSIATFFWTSLVAPGCTFGTASDVPDVEVSSKSLELLEGNVGDPDGDVRAATCAELEPQVLAKKLPYHNGRTAGGATVTPGGSYVYTVPIEMPPPRKGPVPSFTLAYSSHDRANGSPLGVGWRLDYGQAIHRCGKEIEIHGEARHVNYSASDRLCLGGVQLRAAADADNLDDTQYWAQDAFYPVNDPSVRVQHKNKSNGPGTPRWFSLQSTGGITMEYASASADLFKDSGATSPKAGRWNLTQVEDSNANTVAYAYSSLDGTSTGRDNVRLLDTITYDDDIVVSLVWDPNGLPSFVRQHEGYLGGAASKYVYGDMLDSISVKVGTSTVRTYHLSRDHDRSSGFTQADLSNSLGYPFLAEVQECPGTDAAGSTSCREPLDFYYDNPSFDMLEFTKNPVGLSELDLTKDPKNTMSDDQMLMGSQIDTGRQIHYGANMMPIDVDADGDTDILRQAYCPRCSSVGGTVAEATAQGDWYSDPLSIHVSAKTSGVDFDRLGLGTFLLEHGGASGRGKYTNSGINHNIYEPEDGVRMLWGDFNGNGLPDYLRLPAFAGPGPVAAVYLDPGTGTVQRYDLALPYETHSGNGMSTGDVCNPVEYDEDVVNYGGLNPRVGDFDGDGVSELLVLRGARNDKGIWSPEGHPFIAKVDATQPAGSRVVEETLYIDGVITSSSPQLKEQWLNYNPGPAGHEAYGASVFVVDVNNDGRDDLVRQRLTNNSGGTHPGNIGSFEVFLSQGRNPGGFFFVKVSNQHPVLTNGKWRNGGSEVSFVDFNGDGFPDILSQGTGTLGLSNSTVHIRLGLGDGSFGSKLTPSDASGAPFSSSLLTSMNRSTFHEYGLDPNERAYVDDPYALQTTNNNGADLSQGSELITFDANGDGRTDIFLLPKQQKGTPKALSSQLFLSLGDGRFEKQNRTDLAELFYSQLYDVTLNYTVREYYGDPLCRAGCDDCDYDVISGITTCSNYYSKVALGRCGTNTTVGDFDGDLKPDLLVQKWDSSTKGDWAGQNRPAIVNIGLMSDESDFEITNVTSTRPAACKDLPALSVWKHPFDGNGAANRMKKIASSDAETIVEYKGKDEQPRAKSDPKRTASPRHLVSKVTATPDNQTTGPMHAPEVSVEYKYFAATRGSKTPRFLGFEKVETVSEPGNTRSEVESQVMETAGVGAAMVPVKSKSYVGSRLESESTTGYQWKTGNPNGVRFVVADTTTGLSNYCNDVSCLSVGSLAHPNISRAYDEYGNLVRVQTLYHLANREDSQTVIELDSPNTSAGNWTVDRVRRTRTSGQIVPHSSSAPIAGKKHAVEYEYWSSGQVKKSTVVVSETPLETESVYHHYEHNTGRLQTTYREGTGKDDVTLVFDDANNKITTRWNPGYSSNATYDRRFGVLTEATDANGHPTCNYHDDLGRLIATAVVDQDGKLYVAARYGSEKGTLSVDDFERDGASHGQQTIDVWKSITKSTTVDSVLTSVTESSVLGNPVRSYVRTGGPGFVGAGAPTTDFTIYSRSAYDAQGRSYRSSLPSYDDTGANVSLEYDDLYRQRKVKYPTLPGTGGIADTETTYTVAGRRLAVSSRQTSGSKIRQTTLLTNASGDTLGYEYRPGVGQHSVLDFAGRPTEVFAQSGADKRNVTTLEYDGAGRLVKSDNDQRGEETSTFDQYGRLKSYRHVGTHTSDMEGGPKTVVDYTHTYSYDQHHRLAGMVNSEDSQATVFEYCDAISAQCFANSLGRMKAIKVLDTQSKNLTTTKFKEYSATGVLTESEELLGPGEVPYLREWFPHFDGSPFAARSPSGNLSQVVRDRLGRMHRSENIGEAVATARNYDAFGNATLNESWDSNEYPERVRTTKTFDGFGRKTGNRVSAVNNGGLRMNEDIQYNAFGDVKIITDSNKPQRDRVFTFDDVGQLETAEGPWEGQKWYEFDDFGNTLQTDEYTYDYEYYVSYADGDQHNQIKKITLKNCATAEYEFYFDRGGRMWRRVQHGTELNEMTLGDWRQDDFNYNGMGRLKEVVQTEKMAGVESSPAVVESYDYAGDQRLRKVVGDAANPQETIWYVSPSFVVKEYMGSKGPAQQRSEHLFDAEGNLANTIRFNASNYKADKSISHYAHDQVGSVTRVHDHDGDTLAAATYDPFGKEYVKYGKGKHPLVSELQVSSDPQGNQKRGARYSFGGKEKDNNSGLNYFEARYYESILGRFAQADTLVSGTGGAHLTSLNRHAYAANNGVTFSDPTGRMNLAGLVPGGYYSPNAMHRARTGNDIETGSPIWNAVAGNYPDCRKEWRNLGIEAGIIVAFAAVSFGAGAAVGSTAGGVAAGIIIDVALSGAEDAAIQAATTGRVDARSVGMSMAISGLTGGIAGGLGGTASRAVSKSGRIGRSAGAPTPGGRVTAPSCPPGGCTVKTDGCFAAGTKVSTEEGEANIEDLCLGDYVDAPDEMPVEASKIEGGSASVSLPTDEQWVLVRLRSAGLVDIELLAPEPWVLARGLNDGQRFDLSVFDPNLGIHLIESIEPVYTGLEAFMSNADDRSSSRPKSGGTHTQRLIVTKKAEAARAERRVYIDKKGSRHELH